MSEEPQAPKRRNWLVRIVRSRDFTRDIIVTTLGVLIALGIGAIVDEIRWRLRLAATERMMNEEIGVVRGAYAYHLLAEECIQQKIYSLFEILDEARVTHRLPKIERIGFPVDFGPFGDSWELARSSEVMLHMPPSRAMDWASRWVNIRYQTDAVTRQRVAFEEMGNVVRRPGPVTEEQVDEWLAILLRAVRANEIVASFAYRDDKEFAKLGIKRLGTDGKAFDIKDVRKRVAQGFMCVPLQVDGKAYKVREKPKVQSIPLPEDLVG